MKPLEMRRVVGDSEHLFYMADHFQNLANKYLNDGRTAETLALCEVITAITKAAGIIWDEASKERKENISCVK